MIKNVDVEDIKEHLTTYDIGGFIIVFLSSLLGLVATIYYPFVYLHKNFITDVMLLKILDVIPADPEPIGTIVTKLILFGITFPLYVWFFFLVMYIPYSSLWKANENGNNLKSIIRITTINITKKSFKVVFYVLLLSLCYRFSLWFHNVKNLSEEGPFYASSLLIIITMTAFVPCKIIVDEVTNRNILRR